MDRILLSDLINCNQAVTRSVNLERDIGNTKTLRQYQLTEKGVEVLSRFISAIEGEPTSAWSLTGPYGMGKSSFVNFLSALCGRQKDEDSRTSRRILSKKDPLLAQKFKEALFNRIGHHKAFLRVPTTASFEAINLTLAKGLLRAVKNQLLSKRLKNQTESLLLTIETFIQRNSQDTKLLIEYYQEAVRLQEAPVLIMIDEFGKSLEFMARYPGQGDIYALQSLAEAEDVYLFVCLHQAFEAYAAGLTNRQIQEWGKIQGRFEDISFIESRQQMVRFIQDSFRKGHRTSLFDQTIMDWANQLKIEIDRLQLPLFVGWSVDDIAALYPIHPLTALILPELCVRFAQNDRTLFAFLCGGEPKALPAFLSNETISISPAKLATFGPERLYDYFVSSTSSLSIGRPEAQRWIEIQDLIQRARHLPPFYKQILKLIGTLNLISGPSGFRASKQILEFGFFRPHEINGTSRTEFQDALKELMSAGILMYRQYAGEYRLWEGSDFDIQKAIMEFKYLIKPRPLHETLELTLPLAPLTASRHSYRTGTLRHFERHWLTVSALLTQDIECSEEEADGIVCYVLGKEPSISPPPAVTPSGRPIVLAYANFEEQIQELALEAAAAKAVLQEAPELSRDGVARREAIFRAQTAEERLRRYLDDLFRPGNSEVMWCARGKRQDLKSSRHLSYLLSQLCDETYQSCPVLRNELINRNHLSSAAARARRELMEAMTLKPEQENLGMLGTGPEVAIYRSMFLLEGLHCPTGNERWEFTAPTQQSSFLPAWEALSNKTEEAEDREVPIPDLIDTLRRPPIGMKHGPIPILLCLLLLIKEDELALFKEGSFIPFFGPEDMELLVKQPFYFSFKRFAPKGYQAGLFEAYRALLKAGPIILADQRLRNPSIISVVGPLIQFVNNLRPYARNTRSLTKEAQNLRLTLLQARDPIRLLFIELPESVGMEGFADDVDISQELIATFQSRLRTALLELSAVYPCIWRLKNAEGGGRIVRHLLHR